MGPLSGWQMGSLQRFNMELQEDGDAQPVDTVSLLFVLKILSTG